MEYPEIYLLVGVTLIIALVVNGCYVSAEKRPRIREAWQTLLGIASYFGDSPVLVGLMISLLITGCVLLIVTAWPVVLVLMIVKRLKA